MLMMMVIGVYDILWERDLRRIDDLITSWLRATPFTAAGMSDSSS
jgi:hypothetical protein